MLAWLEDTVLLAGFYLKHLSSTFLQLPLTMNNPDLLAQHLKTESVHECYQLSVNNKFVNNFDSDYKQLEVTFQQRNKHKHLSFTTRMWLFFCVRFLCILAAATPQFSTLPIITALSALQFLIAPYSGFVSLTALIVWLPVIFVPHYFLSLLTQNGIKLLVAQSWLDYCSLPVNLALILGFFVADQMLCCFMLFYTDEGKTAKTPATSLNGRLVRHMGYGFLNCKTYFVVLLFYLRNNEFRVELISWALTFPLFFFLFQFLQNHVCHYSPLFYLQHRMAHLPLVYEHAHKFHHFLHDTTAFDAHFFGTGAPEEWCALMVELWLAGKFGICPVTLSAAMFFIEWSNKTGHVRKAHDRDGGNHHPDHHTLHRKNFGAQLLDLYFGTCAPALAAEVAVGFRAHKVVTAQETVLRLQPSPLAGGKD